MSPTPTPQTLRLTYRHLYQHILRAVQYSKPARYIARDHLRTAFRTSPIETYNDQKIARTLEFLDLAARTAGLEHKVVKNVLRVWGERRGLERRGWGRPGDVELRREAYEYFDGVVEKLNESMGMCIK